MEPKLWRISMRSILTVLVAAAFAVSPLAAQALGMPNWSNPKGGTGIMINGDIGIPNEDLGKGTAYGARGSFGLGAIRLTAGIASWKPSDMRERFSSIGGLGWFRWVGDILRP